MSEASRPRTRWTARFAVLVRLILPRLAALLLRALGATWRIELAGREPRIVADTVRIGAIWHRDILVVAYLFRDQQYSVPVSRSRDGDLITDLLLRLGYAPPPRGSSSQGGTAALRGLVRRVDGGMTVALPVDGPRGPARRAKVGVASLARLTGIAVTPVAFSAYPALRFRSWDGTLLPAPFARVVAHFGEPISVGRSASHLEEEAMIRELDARLGELTDRLDQRMGLRAEPMLRGD